MERFLAEDVATAKTLASDGAFTTLERKDSCRKSARNLSLRLSVGNESIAIDRPKISLYRSCAGNAAAELVHVRMLLRRVSIVVRNLHILSIGDINTIGTLEDQESVRQCFRYREHLPTGIHEIASLNIEQKVSPFESAANDRKSNHAEHAGRH